MRSKYHFAIYILLGLLVTSATLFVRASQPLKQYIGQTLTHQTAPLCKKCNVILVSVDTLSALHLPCYGYERNTAPNLCAFAKNHVWFPNSYSQSYFTLPSHFSIFTSLYPSTHKELQIRTDTLDSTHITLAQVLQKRGYNTLYFGPTDSAQLPLDKGIARGFDYIDHTYTYAQDDPNLTYWNKAVAMLKDNQRSKKPTFLFLHTYYVHEPYLPLTRNLHFSKDSIPDIPVTPEEYFSFTSEYIQFAKAYFRQNSFNAPIDAPINSLYQQFLATNDDTIAIGLYNKLIVADCLNFCLMPKYYYERNAQNPRKVAYMRALYDENILRLDTRLKDFFSSLEPLLKENTILIITGDHGEGFMEHDDLGHSLLYNEVLRVPLIVSIPNVLARTVMTPVEGIDIYPTILRFLGIKPENPLEGTDVTSSILGLPFARGKPYIISELYQMISSTERKEIPLKQKTIVTDKWKLYVKDIENLSIPKNLELYDVQKDPRDTTDVAASNPTVVRMLSNQIEQFMKTHTAVFPAPSYKKSVMPQQQIQEQRYFHY